MLKSIPLIAAIAAASAACTQTAEPPRSIAGVDTERQCFFTRSINGYGDAPDGPEGEQRLYIDTGANDRWLFEVSGTCRDLDFAHRIALDTRGLSSVCTGNTETLLVPSAIGSQPDRCFVRLLGKVSDQ